MTVAVRPAFSASEFAFEADSQAPESTLTERFQTTIPAPVRESLHLRKGDKITWRRLRSGEFVPVNSRLVHERQDPALRPFLALLASDIEAHPERLSGIDPGLIARARELTAGVEVDRDAPLDPNDE